MKTTKFFVLLGVFMVCFTLHTRAQDTLPTVTVTAVKYKYLTAVGQKDVAPPVKMLQQKVAAYNVKDADFYEDEYDSYFVSFYIPDGEILAAYDKDGKLLRTVEKYKNVALPKDVRDAVAARFPNWTINKDAYLVNYLESGNAKKIYKLTLLNSDKRVRVKVNEQGEFL